jgi:hypothetical protein
MKRFPILAAALFFVTRSAMAMTLPDYIAQLDGMRAALHEHRLADAQTQAHGLKGTAIDTPAGRIEADPSLLDDVLAGRIGTEAKLAIAVDALRKAAPAASPPADRKLLERLRRDETPDALKTGGEVAQPAVSNQPMLVRIFDAIDKVFDWIGEKLTKLWDWLRQLWPHASRAPGAEGSALRTRWVVGALVVAILAVIGILAWEVIRKSKRNVGTPVTESDPVASRRDEDPMSRGANEWERYAAQLAAAGRIREAIRAWYHAVLVTCYGAGILHYRKGRTNWEYIGALSPELAWRGDFVTFTRRFETEWYGRTTSSREALDECAERAERILEGVHRSAGRGAAA